MNFFAGLITHPRSSYSVNPEFQQLQEALSRLTKEDHLLVAGTDSFTHGEVPIQQLWTRPFRVAWTLWRVRRFRGGSFLSVLFLVLREFVAEASVSGPRKGLKRMVRNRNITASHYLLWKKALDTGVRWTLICEDDVALRSQWFAKELEEIIDFLSNDEESKRPLALFLSQSFSLEAHGLANSSLHVTHVGEQHLIESHDFGWSDTVAATVYSKEFLELLVDYFDRLSEATLATIPVDWLVDLAICELFQENQLRTVHLIPGLCIQQSLQP